MLFRLFVAGSMEKYFLLFVRLFAKLTFKFFGFCASSFSGEIDQNTQHVLSTQKRYLAVRNTHKGSCLRTTHF